MNTTSIAAPRRCGTRNAATGCRSTPTIRRFVIRSIWWSWTSTDPKTSGKLPRELREHLRRIVHKGGQAAADAYPIRRRLVGAAPAYCLTVHKSQGSEWPSGAVVLGRASWLEEDEWRLGYTAITRFREGIVPVVGCWS